MGNFKVSFTTALFVFSFIICVIVAVVFVDRSPRKDDYDSFYDKDKPASTANTDDSWNRRPDASPAPTATAAADPALAELPIDQSLISNTVPVPSYTPVAAPTVSPVKGRTPEEIARMIRQQSSGIPQTAAPAIPTVSIPTGIATPQVPPAAEATAAAYRPAPMRVQSNAPSDGSPGNLAPHGLSPGFSTSNVAGNTWPTMPNTTPTPASMQGFRAMPSNNSGTMIGPNKTETDATPPPGFTGGITREAPATPYSSGSSAGSSVSGFGQSSLQPPPSLSTGGPASSATPASGQLLYAPGSPPGNRSALPPAPTLPPPAIVDPDRPRSDAGDAAQDLLTPDSENPKGSSSQALAISGENPAPPAADFSAPQDEKIAALVNDIELTQAQAEKLATANALLTEKPLTQDNRKKQVEEVISQWTAITAGAEQARENNLSLTDEQFDEYAALRPDMDVEAWKKSLKEAGFSALEIKQRMAEVAYSEKLLEHVASEKYSDAELKKIFDKNPKQFTSAREVHVMEIFKAKPDNKDDIKKVSDQMNRLHQQAAQGTDFGLLANQASEAASKHKGGDRGWETPTDMKDAELAKVLKTMEPGKVSSVIETDEGYRIVKVTEEKPARNDFEGCREKVLEKLKNDLRESTLADAKKNQNVVLSPTGRMITASKTKKEKETASAPSTKNSSASKSDPKTKPNSSASREELAATAAAVVAAESKPATQAFNGNKEFVAAHPETQQLAGGQPQPAQQAGGQTPAPTQNMGYTPGSTIMVGGNAQTSTLNPAGTTTVNHPAEAVQSNSGSADTNAEGLRREAQAMAAQAKAQEQSRTQAAEWQFKQAQAAAYAQEHGMQLPSTVGPDGGVAQAQGESGVSMTATVRKAGAPAPVAAAPNLPVSPQSPAAGFSAEGAMPTQVNALPPAQATPATSQSNGWNVTKQVTNEQEVENQRRATAAAQRGHNQQAQAANAEGDMTVPGFGNNPIGSDNSQGQQSGNDEQKRGIGNRVKSFFSKL